MAPVDFQRILIGGRLLNEHMFAGEYQPERQQHRIEDALANVAQQYHERHIEGKRKVFQWHCIGGTCDTQNQKINKNICVTHGHKNQKPKKNKKKLTIQQRQRNAQIQQHVLEQNGLPMQLMDPMPEPHHYRHNDREKACLQRQPNLCEATILIDDRQLELFDVADVQVHLTIGVDRQPNVQQIVVVMQ